MATFWNVTNHPSAKWSEEQRAAAISVRPGIEEIVDVPFPVVDPSASMAEVEKIAGEIANRIRPVARFNGDVALVQGEMTLVINLVMELQFRGVVCVAATTERDVVETIQPDGSTRKDVIFRFVRFRGYRFLATDNGWAPADVWQAHTV